MGMQEEEQNYKANTNKKTNTNTNTPPDQHFPKKTQSEAANRHIQHLAKREKSSQCANFTWWENPINASIKVTSLEDIELFGVEREIAN